VRDPEADTGRNEEMTMPEDTGGRFEDFKVKGEDLIGKAKELIHEGNIRRLMIINDEGKVLIEIPLTIGVIGAVLLPVWAAIGAIAAVVTDCTIRVEKVDVDEGDDGDG
jgi:hypothetical protein